MTETTGPAAPGFDESLLSAYLDDELDAEARRHVEQRIESSDERLAVLAEVRESREVLRALPMLDAPAAFWDRIMTPDPAVGLPAVGDPAVPDPAVGDPAVGDLVARRAGGGRARVVAAALTAAAAAAVVLAVALVPEETRVQPRLATVTDAHAVRSSLGNDIVSNLAGAAVDEGPRR
jgi:anti-sigma factor RsiW